MALLGVRCCGNLPFPRTALGGGRRTRGRESLAGVQFEISKHRTGRRSGPAIPNCAAAARELDLPQDRKRWGPLSRLGAVLHGWNERGKRDGRTGGRTTETGRSVRSFSIGSAGGWNERLGTAAGDLGSPGAGGEPGGRSRLERYASNPTVGCRGSYREARWRKEWRQTRETRARATSPSGKTRGTSAFQYRSGLDGARPAAYGPPATEDPPAIRGGSPRAPDCSREIGVWKNRLRFLPLRLRRFQVYRREGNPRLPGSLQDRRQGADPHDAGPTRRNGTAASSDVRSRGQLDRKGPARWAQERNAGAPAPEEDGPNASGGA